MPHFFKDLYQRHHKPPSIIRLKCLKFACLVQLCADENISAISYGGPAERAGYACVCLVLLSEMLKRGLASAAGSPGVAPACPVSNQIDIAPTLISCGPVIFLSRIQGDTCATYFAYAVWWPKMLKYPLNDNANVANREQIQFTREDNLPSDSLSPDPSWID